jgi:hypothetical protein
MDGGARRDCGQACGIQGVAAAEFLGLGGTELAFSGIAQGGELSGLQFAQVAGLLIENQGAVADAANLLDEVADLFKHLAQFAVAALDEDDFVPGIVALADLANAGR